MGAVNRKQQSAALFTKRQVHHGVLCCCEICFETIGIYYVGTRPALFHWSPIGRSNQSAVFCGGKSQGIKFTNEVANAILFGIGGSYQGRCGIESFASL